MRAEVQGVVIEWHGGRLADIIMPTAYDRQPHAVEALQVCDYDWEQGRITSEPTVESLTARLQLWLRECYDQAWENA